MQARFLLFTSGGGSSDPLNWDMHEAAMYHIDDLKGIKPSSARSLDLFFETANGFEIVVLGITNSKHTVVMQAITKALQSNQPVIHVADVDSGRFVNKNIHSVQIYSQETYIQTVSNNSRVQVSIPRSNYSSCIIANIDGTDAVACTLELHDGTTYTKLLDQVSIPAKTSLKLEKDEISFDNSSYDLYITSGDSNGQLTLTFNY